MLGFPVVAKPNSGSQGKDVTFAHTKRELTHALREIFKHDKIAIVQKPVPGTDYRIVVLDNAVISAYARIPLTIIGDGRRTIQALMMNLEKHFRKAERDTHIRMNDPRITAKLKRIGYTLSSIPEKGEKISLLDNANLSAGGTSVDVTQSIHSGFKKIAVALTKDMGLRLCGVDLMVNGDITRPPKDFHIIEINAAPGLDHYAKSGKEQQKIVEKLYTRILKSLSKG
jgi:D-alanine-D-alanine ligase-like ATP-grasp enzyme